MRVVDIIAKKRDGLSLSREEIALMVRGYTEGRIPNYQMSALLMAVYLRGMGSEETRALTEEMLHSGTVLDFADLKRPRIDKHSTGGVGDKTSLVIAPVVASAGVLVPMISGRALAHSGGTLDKLEAIPGFRTDLSLREFRDALEAIGVALIGQTAEIAPADKKIYALRDVTATVGCRPLMAASIMSKKMSEGLSGLVLDVKFGNGAFLKDEASAVDLANTMIEIARGLGKTCVALITDMNQPLGRAVGNSLEVIEALETLRGRGPSDLNTLCRELSAEMLVMGGAADDLDQARQLYDERISSGAALEKMRQVVIQQHGNAAAIDNYDLLPRARYDKAIMAAKSGFIQMIDTEAVGRGSMLLGAGRMQIEDEIDPGVGLVVERKVGDRVEPGDTLATLYFNDEALGEEATQTIEIALVIGAERVEPPPLIKTVLR